MSHDPWLVVASDGSAAISSSTERPRVLAAASKSGGGPPSADSSLVTDTPSVFAASVRSGEAPAESAPAAAAGGAPASPSPAGGAPASPLTSPEVEATSFPEVVESLGEVSAPHALNIRAAASESATRDFFGQAVEFMSLTVMDQSVRLRWGGWEARVIHDVGVSAAKRGLRQGHQPPLGGALPPAGGPSPPGPEPAASVVSPLKQVRTAFSATALAW